MPLRQMLELLRASAGFVSVLSGCGLSFYSLFSRRDVQSVLDNPLIEDPEERARLRAEARRSRRDEVCPLPFFPVIVPCPSFLLPLFLLVFLSSQGAPAATLAAPVSPITKRAPAPEAANDGESMAGFEPTLAAPADEAANDAVFEPALAPVAPPQVVLQCCVADVRTTCASRRRLPIEDAQEWTFEGFLWLQIMQILMYYREKPSVCTCR